jgi:serine protease Do
MPSETSVAAIDTENPSSTGKIGVAVQDMNAQVAQQLGVPASISGVVIVEVQPESPASQSGLRAGDIIQEVNRKPIKTVGEFKNAVSSSPNSILLFINRDGHTIYTVVDRNA